MSFRSGAAAEEPAVACSAHAEGALCLAVFETWAFLNPYAVLGFALVNVVRSQVFILSTSIAVMPASGKAPLLETREKWGTPRGLHDVALPTSEPTSNRVIAAIPPPPILSFHVPRSRPPHSAPPLLGIRLLPPAARASRSHAASRPRHLCRHADWRRQVTLLPVAGGNLGAHYGGGLSADCADAGPGRAARADGNPCGGVE